MMKDNRSNLKVNRITRDRLMSIKYALRCKSMDDLLNQLMDEYVFTEEEFRMVE